MHLLRAGQLVDDVLDPYRDQQRVPRSGPCWVLANMVAGLDGSTAFDGRVGALSGGTDSALFARLRALADVVLVGAETVRRERYGPVRLPDHLIAERVGRGVPPTPPIAVVSGSLALDLSIPLFAGPTGASVATGDRSSRPLVLTTRASAEGDTSIDSDVAEVVVVDGPEPTPGSRPRIDIGAALHALAERGARVVLCEGGPALLGELVARDLLDELCLTVAPVMGGDPLSIATVPPGHGLRRFELVGTAVDDGALFLRYVRADS